jgi:hypothetical protein
MASPLRLMLDSGGLTYPAQDVGTCSETSFSTDVASNMSLPLYSLTIIDIIANKFLRLSTVNSKVVQSTGDLHHKIVILFLRIAENIFDNTTSFNPSNDMLNHNPDT